MALPVVIPNTFASATASIPLSQLDTNFTTLANAVNGISSGSETLANVTATVVNATTVDTTNIEVTNIKAKDGTAAGSIADSTGVVTLASSVLTTTDINGGTIDGTAIGGASAAAGSFTTLNTSGQVVFNDAGADVDFRVEGDTNANLLFVDASADAVGIGTSSPGVKLDVSAAGASGVTALRIANTDTTASSPVTMLLQSADDGTLRNRAGINSAADGTNNGLLTFSTRLNGSIGERMRIDSSGNLLVGVTTGTSYKLSLKTSAASQSAIGTAGTSGDTAFQAILITKFDNDSTTSQNFIQFQINNGGANSGKITANGANAATFTSTSDKRIKENIVDLPSQLQNICALRPVEFDYIESEGGGHQIGFIAQDMEEIYSDVVSEQENGMLQISGWSKTEARLVKAIQELKAELDTVKAELATLKG